MTEPPDLLPELRAAIERVARCETVVTPEIAYRLFRRLGELGREDRRRRQLEFLDLTARELEILGLIAQGLSNQEIADRLILSVHTVKNHVHNLLERLGLESREAAVEHARARGWFARPDIRVIAPSLPARPVEVVQLAAGPTRRNRDEALAAAWRMGEELPAAKLLVLGLPREEEELLDFVEAGALGYLLDGASTADLATALHDLHAGRTRCAPRIAAAALARIGRLLRREAQPAAGPREPLTGREIEILRLLASGLSNKEIGKRLSISLSTVKNHVHNLLSKLAARRRRDAVRQAYGQGLLPDLLDGPRRS